MSAADSAPPTKVGTPVASGPRTWVQTERAAHEAWGRLTIQSPRAAAVMHHLVSIMGHQNAVVISQKTLAKMVGCNTRTVQRALNDLIDGKWVQAVQIGASGTVNAYVVNSAVAWGEKREHLRLSVFHAAVVADAADQPKGALDRKALRRVPVIVPPEEALPVGDGEPGAQIALPGLEPVVEGRRDPVDLVQPPAPAAIYRPPPAIVDQLARVVVDRILHDSTGNSELADKVRQLLKGADLPVT